MKQIMIAGSSISFLLKGKWIARLIRGKVDAEWSPSILMLAGAWNDLSVADETKIIRGDDVPREVF